ncbi:MAG: radical SAM protein [Candidatus Sumerlaeia bacterium]
MKDEKVYLRYTEGCCWRRVIDLKLLEEYFRANGCRIVDTPEKADYYILETCAFVKRTEDIAIREIEEAKKYDAKLIVTGCLPGINEERMREVFEGSAVNTADLEDINILFPDFEKPLQLSQDCNELFQQEQVRGKRITFMALLRFLLRNLSLRPNYYGRLYSTARRIMRSGIGLKRHIYYIRISWGCASPHCTFCVEWRAVGSCNISKPMADCLKEVRNGLEAGYRDFAIIADNPAAWGSEWEDENAPRFPDLIRAILEVDPSVNISNIDGIHPFWMKQYRPQLMELVATGRIKSIMSALQSGNNRILELMNRRYTSEEYLDLMQGLRKANPDIILITQIIAGFPSETFEEFQESVDLVIEAEFSNVTVFPYYCNPLTPAAELDKKVDDGEKFRRVEYALKRLGQAGILSLNLGVEVDPRYQKDKALYD